jgi:hypothetical protein
MSTVPGLSLSAVYSLTMSIMLKTQTTVSTYLHAGTDLMGTALPRNTSSMFVQLLQCRWPS